MARQLAPHLSGTDLLPLRHDSPLPSSAMAAMHLLDQKKLRLNIVVARQVQ